MTDPLSNQIIRHDSYGELITDKVYFFFDVPTQFLCHWSNRPQSQYLAILLEQYLSKEYDETSNELVSNYYLAQVNGAIISDLESKNYTIKELFESRPVTWISHRFSLVEDLQSTIIRDHGSISPTYTIAEGTTLCI